MVSKEDRSSFYLFCVSLINNNDLVDLIQLYQTYYTNNISICSSNESESMKLFCNSFYAVISMAFVEE